MHDSPTNKPPTAKLTLSRKTQRELRAIARGRTRKSSRPCCRQTNRRPTRRRLTPRSSGARSASSWSSARWSKRCATRPAWRARHAPSCACQPPSTWTHGCHLQTAHLTRYAPASYTRALIRTCMEASLRRDRCIRSGVAVLYRITRATSPVALAVDGVADGEALTCIDSKIRELRLSSLVPPGSGPVDLLISAAYQPAQYSALGLEIGGPVPLAADDPPCSGR